MTENRYGEIVIGGDAEDIPPGTYPAIFKGFETLPSVKFGGDFRKWTFELDNGGIVTGATSMNTNSKSKGGGWIAAINGGKPEKGEKLSLAGKPCLVVVGLRDDWPTVTGVLPPMAQAAPEPAGLAELP